MPKVSESWPTSSFSYQACISAETSGRIRCPFAGLAHSTATTAAPWGGRLALYGDAAYRSRTYFREFKEKEDSQGAYTIVSLNAIWESENRDWEARLFARNATDEEYRVSQGGGNAIGARTGTYGMPRQVGFEVTRRFGAM